MIYIHKKYIYIYSKQTDASCIHVHTMKTTSVCGESATIYVL